MQALTAAGYLAILIPEQYGGSGLGITAAAAILEEIHRERRQRRRLPRPDVHHGHPAAARQRGAEAAVPAGIASGELRLQAFGVTEPDSGTDTTSLRTTAVRDGDDATWSTARRCGPRAPSTPI